VVALPQVGGLHHRYERQAALRARTSTARTSVAIFDIGAKTALPSSRMRSAVSVNRLMRFPETLERPALRHFTWEITVVRAHTEFSIATGICCEK